MASAAQSRPSGHLKPLARHFSLTGWRLEPDRASVIFTYECERFGRFEETFLFPGTTFCAAGPDRWRGGPAAGLSGILDLLHIAAGVSYYKCAAAPVIVLPARYRKAHLAEMARALYTEGLAEFFIRSNLPYPAELAFRYDAVGPAREEASPAQEMTGGQSPSATAAAPNVDGQRRTSARKAVFADTALVAFGGGKDSHVAHHLLDGAGIATRLVSCVLSDKVATALSATSARPLLFIKRTISANLPRALADGAYNGHVPITAVNALAITVLGYLGGSPYTVFANERSADESTLDTGDVSANHQFSKSGAFEKILIDAIREAAPCAPQFFSLLRPYAEIWIAQTFARIKQAHPLFTSCNRNFRITGERPPRWCGACAKCAFTSLMLAPHMTRDEALVAFSDVFPEKPGLLPLYRALAGLTEQKPWDCVGTVDEVRATLYQLSLNDDWKTARVVTTLLPGILAHTSPAELQHHWQNGLEPAGLHHIPPPIWEAIRDR